MASDARGGQVQPLQPSSTYTWRAPVVQTPARTAALIVLCAGVVAALYFLTNLLLATTIGAAFSLYLLPAYFVAPSYSVGLDGVRWRKGLQRGHRAWPAFKCYRRYPAGLVLSPFASELGQPLPRLNQYRAVYLPFGDGDPASIEAAVSNHLPRNPQPASEQPQSL